MAAGCNAENCLRGQYIRLNQIPGSVFQPHLVDTASILPKFLLAKAFLRVEWMCDAAMCGAIGPLLLFSPPRVVFFHFLAEVGYKVGILVGSRT